jgi:plastocyanin
MQNSISASVLRTRVKWTLPAVLVILFACGGNGERPRRDVVPTPLALSTVGMINVTVTVEGTVPPPREINMRGAAACAAAHSEAVYDNAVLVEDGRLANAVVWLKQGLGDRVFAIPTDPVVIDQKGCLFQPRIVGVMVGQPVTFMNSDVEAHNVHGTPTVGKGWNFFMSYREAPRTIYIDEPEVAIPVTCDVHSWMQAHLAAFEHPYFGVTTAEGTATLGKVPSGDYVLAVWHERLGSKEQKVRLSPKGSLSVRFTLEVP